MQTNKIGSVLLKSFKWIFVFSLMFITLFGIALALSQPQSAVGWVLAITPAVIWNFKRIFLLSYKLSRAVFLLIHKRKWTAIVFWGGCFWWQWQVTLLLLVISGFIRSNSIRSIMNPLWVDNKSSGSDDSDLSHSESIYSSNDDRDYSTDQAFNKDSDLFSTESIFSSHGVQVDDFANHDSSHDNFHDVNPANGLPMVDDAFDTAGNAYGTSGAEDPFSH